MGLLDSLFNLGKREIRNAAENALKEKAKSASQKVYSYTFEKMPENLEELKAMRGADLKDPATVAALCVLALDRYGKDREACFAMMDYLKGPEPLTPYEKQMINNQHMDGKDYVLRSYLEGAAPENNYTPSQPFTIKPFENPYSRENYSSGYIKIFLNSGGADSARYVVLRTKPSTGQWFINQFQGLLSGIRIPKEQDKWA